LEWHLPSNSIPADGGKIVCITDEMDYRISRKNTREEQLPTNPPKGGINQLRNRAVGDQPCAINRISNVSKSFSAPSESFRQLPPW